VDFTVPDVSSVNVDCANDTVCAVTIQGENGEEKTIDLPKDSDGNIAGAPLLIQDVNRNGFVIDENGNVKSEKDTYVYENEYQNKDNQSIDTTIAKQKIKDLVTLLQQRIREYLENETEKYPKLAFENENVLSSIAEYDANIGAGGQYRNGKLYVGTRNFTENREDEDILATIYHEYMHYLNWKFGNRYRMADLETGIVYTKTIICFEKRIQSEDEFFNDAYQLFILDKMKTPDADVYLDYPAFYEELNDIQKEEVNKYTKNKNLKPEVICFSFDYSPSNFYKDEINAHTETLNANDKKMLKMSDGNISFYYSEINRYTNLYNKAETYEINNNINSDGYEK
jgi:hypothetical protein